jgi:type II secretory pathway component PulF
MPQGAWIPWLLQSVPLIGPPLRLSRLAQFARLLGLLLDQQVPLPEALRLTASALHDPDMALACRQMAIDVESGRALHESLTKKKCFPASLAPLVQWGQQSAALGDAFRAAAEMFEGGAQSRSTPLEIVIAPLAFLAVAAFIGFFVLAMLLPLISLIQKLS